MINKKKINSQLLFRFGLVCDVWHRNAVLQFFSSFFSFFFSFQFDN